MRLPNHSPFFRSSHVTSAGIRVEEFGEHTDIWETVNLSAKLLSKDSNPHPQSQSEWTFSPLQKTLFSFLHLSLFLEDWTIDIPHQMLTCPLTSSSVWAAGKYMQERRWGKIMILFYFHGITRGRAEVLSLATSALSFCPPETTPTPSPFGEANSLLWWCWKYCIISRAFPTLCPHLCKSSLY